MRTVLSRVWFRRCLAALLASEGAYLLGLTILLGMIVPSVARFDGNEPDAIAVALAGGVGLTMAVVCVAAAIVVWREASHPNHHWLADATVLAAAALHVMLAIGALVGLLSFALGRSETGSGAISLAGWSAAAAAGVAVAFALTATRRPSSTRTGPQHL